jgi:hypothetical protein
LRVHYLLFTLLALTPLLVAQPPAPLQTGGERPIDLRHIRLDLRVDLPGKSVAGSAALRFETLVPVKAVTLDAVGFEVVVDIVTERNAQFFATLMTRPGHPATPGPELHVAAFRPALRDERTELDAWLHPLTLGAMLPVVPLALLGGGCVPVDLEATYTQARDFEGV